MSADPLPNAVQPVIPACSLAAKSGACPGPAVARRPEPAFAVSQASCIQRPNAAFEPVGSGPDQAPEIPSKRGQKRPRPLPRPAWRSGHSGTLLGATGGDPNTLAPNKRKLGQVRDTRQELVRVPESNTKYGGKGRKTGGMPAPVSGSTIGESYGIPKGKNLCID